MEETSENSSAQTGLSGPVVSVLSWLFAMMSLLKSFINFSVIS